MQFLAILIPLAGIVASVGFIWLLVVAFRNSALWGVLVLVFSPISAIVFAIKYWSDAKRPFLVYMGSCVALFMVMLSMAMFVGGSMVKAVAEMEQAAVDAQPAKAVVIGVDNKIAPVHELTTEPQAAAPQAVDQNAALAVVERTAPVVQHAPPPADSSAGTRDAAQRNVIPVSRLGEHVGERVRVVTKNGGEFIGHYSGTRDHKLEFEKHLAAGVVAVFFDRAEVSSVHKVHRR